MYLKVLQIIPQSMFAVLHQIIRILTHEMSEVTPFNIAYHKCSYLLVHKGPHSLGERQNEGILTAGGEIQGRLP